MYKGTGASPGIALGKALVIEHSELVIEKKTIENIDKEIQKPAFCGIHHGHSLSLTQTYAPGGA